MVEKAVLCIEKNSFDWQRVSISTKNALSNLLFRRYL